MCVEFEHNGVVESSRCCSWATANRGSNDTFVDASEMDGAGMVVSERRCHGESPNRCKLFNGLNGRVLEVQPTQCRAVGPGRRALVHARHMQYST